MLGYGPLPMWLAPAIAVGLAESVWRSWRSSLHRLVIIAVLAAPFSASIVDIRITRVLAMMVPATILAVIGLGCIGRWLQRWLPTALFAALVALALITATITMTVDALANGPTWFEDYGMGGMQWGAEQIYDALRPMLEMDPHLSFVVSHSWANWPNAYPEFFLDRELRQRVHIGVIDEYVMNFRPRELSRKQLFVMTADEYQAARSNPMLEVSNPRRVIPYPDGNLGFVITSVVYSEDAREIFEAEQAERREPQHSTIELAGSPVRVVHPKFDIGDLEALFDGKHETIARTLDADPCVLTFTFSQERSLSGVRVTIWTPHYDLALKAIGADGSVNEAGARVSLPRGFGTYQLMLSDPVPTARQITVVFDKRGDNKVHIQEIEFLP
jgi:hypothetical protein